MTVIFLQNCYVYTTVRRLALGKHREIERGKQLTQRGRERDDAQRKVIIAGFGIWGMIIK